MTFQFRRMSMRQGCQRRFWNAEQCQGWLGFLHWLDVVDHISLSLSNWKCSHWLYSGKSISPRWNPWKSSDWNRRFFSRLYLQSIPPPISPFSTTMATFFSQGRCLEEWNFDFGQVFSEKWNSLKWSERIIFVTKLLTILQVCHTKNLQVCHPQFHQHMAKPDRGCSWEPDDACKGKK